jgi:hypothetical protein
MRVWGGLEIGSKVLGLVDIIEQLVQKVRQQEEKIAQLEDEIAVLKGEKKRPRFKPSQLDKQAGRGEGALGEGKRPGSEKRSKTASLVIHGTFSLSPGRLGNSKPRINVFQ